MKTHDSNCKMAWMKQVGVDATPASVAAARAPEEESETTLPGGMKMMMND